MIVCSCNVLTDSEIRAALASEACPRTPSAVYKCLGCSLNCGRCITTVRTVIDETVAKKTPSAKPSRRANCEMDTVSLCPL